MANENLTTKTAQTLLASYKENEADNSHSENMVLLADNLGNEEARFLANANRDFNKKFGFSNSRLNEAAYYATQGLYKELYDLSKS